MQSITLYQQALKIIYLVWQQTDVLFYSFKTQVFRDSMYSYSSSNTIQMKNLNSISLNIQIHKYRKTQNNMEITVDSVIYLTKCQMQVCYSCFQNCTFNVGWNGSLTNGATWISNNHPTAWICEGFNKSVINKGQ